MKPMRLRSAMNDPKKTGRDRTKDPGLYDLYAERLLIPGWAGLLTLEDAHYIQSELLKRPALKRKWGISGRRLTAIAERAFPENPEIARKHIKQLQTRMAY